MVRSKSRDGAAVERTASTVNGSVEIGKRARVGGDVSTVSGEIELKGAEVGGKLTTRNGDIELTDGARVRGGIHVKKKATATGVSARTSRSKCTSAEPAWSKAICVSIARWNCASIEGAKIGQVIGDSVTRR